MKKFTHGRPVPQFYTELVQLCNFNKFQFADMSACIARGVQFRVYSGFNTGFQTNPHLNISEKYK